MSELPKSSGRPLIENPVVPMIGYLEGEFGEKFLKVYNSVVKEKYGDNESLKVLEFEDGVVKGSSTYSSIVAAEVLRQNGLEIARPFDIESARKLHQKTGGASGIDTSGYYVDFGIVLRSVEGPNEYLAKQLEPQAKKALGIEKIKNPVVILSGDLELCNDGNAPEGKGLSLRSGSKPFKVPALKEDCRFNETDENGMPIPDENGARTSYTIDSGLSRLYLDGDLDLLSDWNHLALSYPDGRVVAVKR